MEFTRRETLKCAGAATVAAFSGCAFSDRQVVPQQWHKTVCRFCGVGCGLMVGLNEEKVAEVKGDELAHNQGKICVKGSMLTEIFTLPNRLLHPMIRKHGYLERASWDEAMALVASRFKTAHRSHGPRAVAFYGSGQLFIEESYTANKLFRAGLRTNNVDGNARLCMASAAVGYVQTFGKDEPLGCYEDIEHATCFFLMGSNAYECHPVLFERILLRKRQDSRVKLIVVDPRRTKTAAYADAFVQVIPGTDLLLLNAMAHVMVEDGLIDPAFIAAHCKFIRVDGREVGLADYRMFLKPYCPETVASKMGISAPQIREIAYLFAQSKATLSLWTMGVNQRTQGVFLNNALHGLHLLTRQICRPGASPLSLSGQGNACGGVRDTGSLAHLLPAGRMVANQAHRAEVEHLWGLKPGTISPTVGYDAVELFTAIRDGRVRAVLIMGTNPMQTIPDLNRVEKGADSFITVVEPFADARTLEIADVVLPAALWIEKQGVYGQTERRYQLLEKLLTPPGEARSDFEILVDLAQRLNLDRIITAHTPEAAWKEWSEFSASSKYNFKGITYPRLRKERGLQWPCPTETHLGTKRRFVGGDDPLVTPGKAIEFYGQPDKKARIFLRPYIPSPQQPSTHFPLLLTTGRVLEQWQTGTITDKIAELSQANGRGYLELNRQEAHRYGISTGDLVRVISEFGDLVLTTKVTDSPKAGVVFVPFFDAKRLINYVVSPAVGPLSKQPEYKVTAVRIEKA